MDSQRKRRLPRKRAGARLIHHPEKIEENHVEFRETRGVSGLQSKLRDLGRQALVLPSALGV